MFKSTRLPLLRPLSSPIARALLGAALSANLVGCGDDLPATTDVSSSSGSSSTTEQDPTNTPPTTTTDPTTETGPTDPTTTTTDPTTTTTDPSGPTDPTTGSTTIEDTSTGSTTLDDTSTGSTTIEDTSTGSTTEAAACGNGVVDEGELCDDGINDGSYNGCNPDCAALGPFCGDGVIDEPETCDDANEDNEDDCTVVCGPPACGDNLVQANEECDGENLGGADCVTVGFEGGILACVPELCTFETSACEMGGVCGNGMAEAPELCDGEDFAGQTCADADPNVFSGGDLACADTCDAIDTALCDSGTCCQIGPASACDVPAILQCVCDQDTFCCNNSWDETCVGEAVDCGAVCQCNDGELDPDEVCDGDDLLGETCQTQGFEAGTLACSSTCEQFDTSNCGASCCVEAGAGECNDPVVLACVCDVDPFCCATEWDGLCTARAANCGAPC